MGSGTRGTADCNRGRARYGQAKLQKGRLKDQVLHPGLIVEDDELSRCDYCARDQYWSVTAHNWYNVQRRHDLHVVVRMNFAVTYFPSNLIEHWFDVLVQVPMVDSGEGRKT